MLQHHEIIKIRPGSTDFGVSVIICCYNSVLLIERTLEYVRKQLIPDDFTIEVVIVDNASSDDTLEVAKAWWNTQPYSNGFILKTLEELRQGLIYARLAGAKNSQFPILLYCDDDNFLDKDYILTAYQIMKDHPEVGACGGKGRPIFETSEIPDWFERHQKSYAVGAQYVNEGLVNGYELYGAGLVIRREIITTLSENNYKFLTTGRKGKLLSAGDDHEITMLSVLMGYRLWYSESLTFQHFISGEKLSRNFLKHLYKGFGMTLARLTPLRLVLSGQHQTYRNTFFYQLLRSVGLCLKDLLRWEHPDRFIYFLGNIRRIKGMIMFSARPPHYPWVHYKLRSSLVEV
ncbi:MAG: glycosyltransferase [Saprospiraceae bacterium]|nr:glycosyltransferase [Saprospiraceae bacterium]